ncbi:MAG: ATP-binding protein [Bacilli bacterium]|nr:ATP-binding protein [Bacilli bacterium]
MLKRKIDLFLNEWLNNKNRLPLIVKGARQIGKTTSIMEFANKNYESVVNINFINNKEYKSAFESNDVNNIISYLSILNPNFKFIPHKTLIFIDEVQEYPNACSSLKFFKLDGRYDVICSGSLLGIHYNRIHSISVGFKEDYTMHSLDFEEFLWAKGYDENQINFIFSFLKDLKPLPEAIFEKLNVLFKQYIYCGGMPRIVDEYVQSNVFNEVFSLQKQLYIDYEEDITKYVEGLDVSKVKNIYKHITPQLAKDNHKFQITKLGHGARSKEYKGCEEWLRDAGVINIAYNLQSFDLPLKGNEIDNYFRIYYSDTSLLLSSIDEESKKDFIINGNYQIYNGALFENIVAEALTKQGYEDIFFYKNDSATIELDFVIRVKNEIIPIEVKAKKGRAKSLRTLLDENIVNYGIKLSNNNIGFDGKIFTIPSFLTFLLKRFFNETDYIKW